MVVFNTGYVMPMDRGYGESSPTNSGTGDVGVGTPVVPMGDVGMSVPFGIAAPNVQGIAAKMRTGLKVMELQFAGAGRSQRGSQTPGIYGELQRQALKELRKANEVEYTTHASFGVMGLAGMDQQGNFSKQAKKSSLDEIKRAIEFASDVAEGGSVVVHTGEFFRPVSEAPWNKERYWDPVLKKEIKNPWAGKLQMYKEEGDKAVERVIDTRTGQVVLQVRKDQKVARPDWLVAKAGEEFQDFDGTMRKPRPGETIYLDYFGNRLVPEKRVPRYDETIGQAGGFAVRYQSWEDFEKEADIFTKRAREFWRKNQHAPESDWQDSLFLRFKNAKSEAEIRIRPEEAYVMATLETNAANSRGWALYYGGESDKQIKSIKRFEDALKFWQEIEAKTPKEDIWRLFKQQGDRYGLAERGLIAKEDKLPSDLLKEALSGEWRSLDQGREASASQFSQAKDTEETMRFIESAQTYGLKESSDAYSDAGIFAWRKWDQLQRKYNKEGRPEALPDRPLFVAMEHIFPESYGGHPDEIVNLVLQARDTMAHKLVKEYGLQQKKAQEVAQTHIKVHLDTGHMNIWRKMWVNDPKKNPEQNDADYDKWMLEHLEKMAKNKLIGSVHLNDNWGYNDEHLSPGQGNGRVLDMVKILKKHGYEGKLVVEPGADASTDLSDFHGVMKTWRLFGSNMYGMGFGSSGTPTRGGNWANVQYGYFGQAHPPNFVFGGYVPSEDWTLWSGVQME